MRRLGAWALGGVLLLFSGRAPADEPVRPPRRAPTAEDLELAKRLFHNGNELRRAGDCERALEFYRRSRALVPSVPNTVNAAFCLNELKRYDEALELYEELMVRFSEELSEEDRLSLAPVMTTLRRAVATLDISSNTTGLVVIDGRPRGRLPLPTALRVLSGRHTLRVIADGFEPFERTVQLSAGETTRIDALLKPLSHRGSLRVESSAPATVFIDGAPVDAAPWQGALPPGRHVYWTRGRTHGSAPTVVTVVEGQVVKVRARSEPLGPELRVRVEPPSAELSIDGVRLNQATWQGRLPRGRHRFEAAEVGYKTVSMSDDLAREAELVLTLEVDWGHPRWRRGARTLRVEALVGFAMAPGLGSDAEASCDVYACPENDIALGALAAGRFGYQLDAHFSIEAGIGYLAFRTGVSRAVSAGFAPTTGAPQIQTRYLIKDEILLAGPFASVGASATWPLGKRLFVGLGGHLGGWFVAGSDRATGSIAGAGEQQAIFVEGSGTTTRSTDVLVMLDGRLATTIGGIGVTAGFAATAFLLPGPAGTLGDVEPSGDCTAARLLGCAPGEPFLRDREEATHGLFVALGPYVSASHHF